MNGGLGEQRVGKRSDGEVRRRVAWMNSGESPRTARQTATTWVNSERDGVDSGDRRSTDGGSTAMSEGATG